MSQQPPYGYPPPFQGQPPYGMPPGQPYGYAPQPPKKQGVPGWLIGALAVVGLLLIGVVVAIVSGGNGAKAQSAATAGPSAVDAAVIPGGDVVMAVCDKLVAAGVAKNCKLDATPWPDPTVDVSDTIFKTYNWSACPVWKNMKVCVVTANYDLAAVPGEAGGVVYRLTNQIDDAMAKCEGHQMDGDYPDYLACSKDGRTVVTWGTPDDWDKCHDDAVARCEKSVNACVEQAGEGLAEHCDNIPTCVQKMKPSYVEICAQKYPTLIQKYRALNDAAESALGTANARATSRGSATSSPPSPSSQVPQEPSPPPATHQNSPPPRGRPRPSRGRR